MNSNNEFVPFENFARTIRFWWVIVLLAILGGAIGYVVHLFKASVYESQAVFMGSIDFNKIALVQPPGSEPAPYQMTLYDEDITLVLVEVSIRQVIPSVVAFAQANGMPIETNSLLGQSTIERRHAFWELRFRYSDPVLAQKVVNYWANLAYADLQSKQKAGNLPPYFLFDLVQQANLPKSPTYFQTNRLVLSGCLIGLVVGILGINLPHVEKPQES